MIMDIGPFRFYRSASGTLDVSLICMDNLPCGWEYGWFDPMRGQDRPFVSVRVGKLQVVYFEKYETGFEVWFMGLWWIWRSSPSD